MACACMSCAVQGTTTTRPPCRWRRALKATVCVSAGIHYDHISREEIDTVLALARMLGACGLRRLRRLQENDHADSERS